MIQPGTEMFTVFNTVYCTNSIDLTAMLNLFYLKPPTSIPLIAKEYDYHTILCEKKHLKVAGCTYLTFRLIQKKSQQIRISDNFKQLEKLWLQISNHNYQKRYQLPAISTSGLIIIHRNLTPVSAKSTMMFTVCKFTTRLERIPHIPNSNYNKRDFSALNDQLGYF